MFITIGTRLVATALLSVSIDLLCYLMREIFNEYINQSNEIDLKKN